MAVWIIPALKAILPHAGAIIEAARPILTKRKGDESVPPSTMVQQQVAELQTAVAQNDTHVRELAQQLQVTVKAIQDTAVLAENRSRNQARLTSAAMIVAALSLVLSVVAIVSAG